MKRKRFSPLSVVVYRSKNDFRWIYLLPSLEYRHKYWYLWEFAFSWLKWRFTIEFCRIDWNEYDSTEPDDFE